MVHGQVPSPAGLGRSGASAITSLRSTRPAARPPVRPARADAGRAASAGPWSPGELEEGRRAPAKCSSGAASLNSPSYPWSQTHLSPFHRPEAQRPAQPPKVTQPCSHPAAADFKTFLPGATRSQRLSGAGRAQQLSAPRHSLSREPALPPEGGARTLLPPGSAVAGGASRPTPRAPGLSGPGTYSASSQPAKRPAGNPFEGRGD